MIRRLRLRNKETNSCSQMSPTKTNSNSFNIAVLGAGPAGSAAALALRRLDDPPRVLLVEASRFDAVRIGESVPPDVCVLLRQLGVWQAFRDEGHDPCHGSCSSWGSDELGYNDFLFNPHGHGWHLDRRRFDAFLAQSAADAGADLRLGTRFLGTEDDGLGDDPGAEDGYLLQLEDGTGERSDIRARFVVDATGAGARFARRRGARRVFHDRLVCATVFFDLNSSDEERTFTQLTMLEAVEDGWWYAAQLPGARLAVAFASDSEIVKATGTDRQEGLLAHLRNTRHLASMLAGCSPRPDSLELRVASSSRLDRVVGDGWLAVGDAATTYDPISSQGVYKALADGLRGAQALAARLDADRNADRDVDQEANPAKGPMDRYSAATDRGFARYLEARDYFYDLERRWPDSIFWQRRRGATERFLGRLSHDESAK